MSLITTPTFIIGLGGIGNIVVRLIRERFLSSGLGLPETVRLRSIDTAEQIESDLAGPLPREMFTLVGNFAGNQVVGSLHLFPLIAKWWKFAEGSYAPGFIQNGAGAKRPVGRLVFFHQFQRFFDAIRGDLEAPKKVEVQNRLMDAGLGRLKMTPRVFIVGSLAGGTCSGTCLDVAFLTRHLLGQLGYDTNGASLTGVWALPSVIHVDTHDGHSQMGQQRQLNAVAALSELDWLMRGWSTGQVQLDYPPPVGSILPVAPLFDQVYLFSDRKSHGVMFSQQRDILQRAAHFIHGQVALGTGEAALQVLDNYKARFDPSQQQVADGMIAVYSSFGVEWLEIPHQHVIRSWAERIGKSVGSRVRDFDWGREPRRNRNQTVWDALDGDFEPFRVAIDIPDASTGEEVALLRGVPDIEAFLTQAQSSTTTAQLKEVLRAFDTQLPGQLDGLRKVARALPPSSRDVEWTRRFASRLLRAPEFRAGGARRMLETAAEKLAKALAPPPATVEPIDEVVKKCSRWFGFKVEHGPALQWMRSRLLQQAQALVRAEFGARCSELARQCERQVAVIETLQKAVQEESGRLGHTRANAWEPPKDSWLLDPEDIGRAIEANADAVTDAVVGAVCDELADELDRIDGRASSELKVFFEREFHEAAMRALEREAVKHTRRPQDSFERLRRIIENCEPMAQVIDQGPDFLRVMSDSQRSTPLRFVLTAIEGEQRTRLREWTQEEARQLMDPNAFQVLASPDLLRDDALHLTFGWPLWLFSEVRACQETVERLRQDNPRVVQFSRTLLELNGPATHELRPMPETETLRLFGYALVLGHVLPIRENRVVFREEVFGQCQEAQSMEEARTRFVRLGLNRRISRLLADEELRPGFVQLVRDSLARRRSELAAGVPPAVHQAIEQALLVVDADLQRVVSR